MDSSRSPDQADSRRLLKTNIAIILTWIRIAAIPVVVYCFFSAWELSRPLAGVVFAIASITDLLDGYVARRLGQASRFGEFLDPVADKLMVAVALVLLVQGDPRAALAIVAAIIIGREITVSALREWMASIGQGRSVAVSWGGKIKTTLQMVGIGFMLYQQPMFGQDVYELGFVFLLAAAGMTLWSMFAYVRAAWPTMTGGRP